MTKQKLCAIASFCLMIFLCTVTCSGYAYGSRQLSMCLLLNESGELTLEIEQAGNYAITLDYQVPGNSMLPSRISVQVNGETQSAEHANIELPAYWKDTTQEYATDLYGNELLPEAIRIQDATMSTTLANTIYGSQLAFYLAEGENIITITSLQGSLDILSVTAYQPVALVDTETYNETIPGDAEYRSALIVLQGEKYSYKNKAGILAQKSRDVNFTPYDAAGNRVNALDGVTWADATDAVTWEFTIEDQGIYYLAFKYQQNEKHEYPSYKNIWIDGEQCTDPMAAFAFQPTGASCEISVLEGDDGQGLGIYFTSGTHTLTLESTAVPYEQLHKALRKVIEEMNALALEVRLISGGKIDTQRDWNIEDYMPDIRDDLTGIMNDIETAQWMLSAFSSQNEASEAVSVLSQIQGQLSHYLSDTRGLDHFVNQIDAFAQSSGSSAETITLLLPNLIEQPVTLDEIYITGDLSMIPDPKVTLGEKMTSEIDKLAASFSGEADVSNMLSDDALNVWMLGSAPQVEVLRELCMEQYGNTVMVSVMSDEQKLLLAISSGEAPDVVIGATSLQPYRLAIRGALYNLREFPDFLDVITCFEDATLVPFIYEDGVYALPQTVNFWCLIYRTDYMQSLGLTVPQTWEDLIEQLPTMYRYGLEVNTLLANLGSLKTLLATTPFIMQYDADLYLEDGSDTCFLQPDFIQAFTLMTELYTKYGITKSVGNFYSSFVNGNIAMGIGDISTYLLLEQSSSGMEGLWDIALIPGVANEDGSINRSFPTVATGSCILKDTKDPAAAWEFLKWWMQDDVQARYARQLLTTYGDEYVYLSANVRALEMTDILPANHQSILLEQIANSNQTPCHPADMLVERALSNAWTNVVVNGMDIRTALDNAANEAKRGIDRKLKEFGYMDDLGNLITPLDMASRETVAAWYEENAHE